ncbi:GlsB/YeaQ/YmgE family stress response membrane protein [candidate division KSB1 bacterium]|nr:GlsB/YeaQ/YmgE family stress response membrane protein [candidate division KSB1 bacterium]
MVAFTEFSLVSFLIMCLIAAVCGAIGSAIAGIDSKGCITNIVIGLIGAMIGRWLSYQIKMPDILYYKEIPILWTIIGSALFIFIISLIMGNRKR